MDSEFGTSSSAVTLESRYSYRTSHGVSTPGRQTDNTYIAEAKRNYWDSSGGQERKSCIVQTKGNTAKGSKYKVVTNCFGHPRRKVASPRVKTEATGLPCLDKIGFGKESQPSAHQGYPSTSNPCTLSKTVLVL